MAHPKLPPPRNSDPRYATAFLLTCGDSTYSPECRPGRNCLASCTGSFCVPSRLVGRRLKVSSLHWGGGRKKCSPAHARHALAPKFFVRHGPPHTAHFEAPPGEHVDRLGGGENAPSLVSSLPSLMACRLPILNDRNLDIDATGLRRVPNYELKAKKN